jgi:hypothetical protein
MKTVEQYVQEEMESLKKFLEYWKRNSAANPEFFPMALPDENAGEWTDQFVAFRDAIEGTKNENETFTPKNNVYSYEVEQITTTIKSMANKVGGKAKLAKLASKCLGRKVVAEEHDGVVTLHITNHPLSAPSIVVELSDEKYIQVMEFVDGLLRSGVEL